jgi:hypothetical protein
MVTLYFVEGIEMEDVARQPIDRREVQERKWIPVAEFIHEAFRQSTVDSILGHCVSQPKYCTFLVKTFAYFVSEWQTMRRTGMLS